MMVIKVRHKDRQLYAFAKKTQSNFMEGIYFKKYQWGPKIRNSTSVSKMAAVRRSKCWIFVIFLAEAALDTTDLD